jgi:hypothetical protein
MVDVNRSHLIAFRQSNIIHLLMLKAAFIGLFLIGFSCIIGSKVYLTENRWCPLTGALPRKGLSATLPFTVRFPGRYRFEVARGIGENSNLLTLQELPPIVCDFKVTMTNTRGWSITTEVTSLRRTSRFAAGNMDYFEGGEFDIPSAGEYVFQLATVQDVSLEQRGQTFSLRRDENAADAMVFFGLVRIAGVCAVMCGSVLLMVWIVAKLNYSKRPGAPGAHRVDGILSALTLVL